MNGNLGIDLAQYQMQAAHEGGAGAANSADLAQLEKAMYAGEITGRETSGLTDQPGATLKVESLENTLKVITFKESDIVLWKKIPKLPAYNTVEEYNQLADYGAENYSFTNEGELPEEDDSTYIRQSQLVKFMGTTRAVSHPMQLVNTMIGNVVQRYIQDGTLKILRDVDKALVSANSAIIPQQFNGLYKQHFDQFGNLTDWYNDDVVIDLKGKALDEGDIEDAALTVIENHGEGSLLMAPPKVLSNFVKRFHDSKLIQPNTPQVTAGVMGQNVQKFQSQFGAIDLGFDKFMKSAPAKKLTATSTSTKAPNAPVADVTTPKAAKTDTLSEFGTAFAGDYYYAVSAINRYGESGLANLATVGSPNAKLTIASGEAAELKFADGGGAVAATGYQIYRSVKTEVATTAADAKFYPIYKIAKAELTVGYDGGAAGLVWDRNRSIPNTEEAFLTDPDTDVWAFKQLAPLMKMDLAIIGPATRFMILLYGTPILYAPKKLIHFINIGTDLT